MRITQPSMRVALAACLLGAVAAAFAAWLGVSHVNGSNVWSPGPLLTVVPAWLIGDGFLGGVDFGIKYIPVIGFLLFLILATPLWLPASRVTWPTSLFSAALVCGSIWFFLDSWRQGFEYQGVSYTVTLAVVNFVLAAASILTAWRAYRGRHYWMRYTATLIPSVWCVWFAFPWLGEMP